MGVKGRLSPRAMRLVSAGPYRVGPELWEGMKKRLQSQPRRRRRDRKPGCEGEGSGARWGKWKVVKTTAS